MGRANIRPISGLDATNLGYLPATKAVYLYQSAVFIGQNGIFGKNRDLWKKHKSARLVLGL
jgi:hypothetical protein